jgi:REP element-mobilizing transposase RayT
MRSRYKVCDDAYPYFMTCTIVGWLPVFTRPFAVKEVLDSWCFLQRNKRLAIYVYVIMENHLHLIASSNDLAKEIGDFKSYVARRIIDQLEAVRASDMLRQLQYFKAPNKVDREHQLWQEGSHPQMIQHNEMMWQKIEYMHNNPLRRGYVDDPLHWKYSSARNYAGMPGLIDVTTDW